MARAATGSNLEIAFIKEITPGTTPGSGTLSEIRKKDGESLAGDADTIVSGEVRSDRQQVSSIRDINSVGGAIPVEFSYATYDDFLLAVMGAPEWESRTMTEITIAAADSDPDTFTDSASGFVTAGFEAGDWVKVSGFTESANNGHFRIATVAAGTLTLESTDTLTAEVAGDSVTIATEVLKLGSQDHSFTVQKAFTDKMLFLYWAGVRVSELGVEIVPGSQVEGSFTLIGGGDETVPGSGLFGPSDYLIDTPTPNAGHSGFSYDTGSTAFAVDDKLIIAGDTSESVYTVKAVNAAATQVTGDTDPTLVLAAGLANAYIEDLTDSDFVTNGYKVGQKITLATCTTGANDGTYTIKTVTETRITLADTEDFDTAEAFAAGTTLDGAQHLKISPPIGEAVADNAAISTYRPATAVSTNQVFDSFSGVIRENNVAVSVVTKLSISVNGNQEAANVVGSQDPVNVDQGEFAVSVSLSTRFESLSLYNKGRNSTATSIEQELKDVDGNSLYFVFPNVRLNKKTPTGANRKAIIQDFTATCLRETTRGTSMLVYRVPA
jgi:hypothetical protein